MGASFLAYSTAGAGPLPSMRSFHLSVPLKLKVMPVWYCSMTVFSRAFTAIWSSLYQSLWSWFFFLWNLIAQKSADSIAPFSRNSGVG